VVAETKDGGKEQPDVDDELEDREREIALKKLQLAYFQEQVTAESEQRMPPEIREACFDSLPCLAAVPGIPPLTTSVEKALIAKVKELRVELEKLVAYNEALKYSAEMKARRGTSETEEGLKEDDQQFDHLENLKSTPAAHVMSSRLNSWRLRNNYKARCELKEQSLFTTRLSYGDMLFLFEGSNMEHKGDEELRGEQLHYGGQQKLWKSLPVERVTNIGRPMLFHPGYILIST